MNNPTPEEKLLTAIFGLPGELESTAADLDDVCYCLERLADAIDRNTLAIVNTQPASMPRRF